MHNDEQGTQTDEGLPDGEFSSLAIDEMGNLSLESFLREFPQDSYSCSSHQGTGSISRNFCYSSPLPEHRYLATPTSWTSDRPPRPKSPWGCLDPYTSEDQDREYVGFATLPNQVHRKSVKKGFEFTLMVVGESGLGKSTLVNSLFLTDLYKDRKVLNAEERLAQTVGITKNTVCIEEKGVKLKLNVVDTQGYGDTINNTDSYKCVSDYIDQQFEQYRRDEIGLDRKNIQDNRVHCCLYFISPFGHGLQPLDVECMRALQDKVNIIPVVAKSDGLTYDEVKKKKSRILSEIDKYRLKIYQFPDCDSDEDEEFRRQDMELKRSVPFAVIGSNRVVDVNGRRIRARLYPWGVVEGAQQIQTNMHTLTHLMSELQINVLYTPFKFIAVHCCLVVLSVENPYHSDFVHLRNMLVRTHMQDLKDMTHDTHYESYRAQWLCKSQRTDVDYDFCHTTI